MKARVAIAVMGMIGCISGKAVADTLDSLFASWSAGQYDEVLQPLLRYRSGPGGRSWKVDYMIGTSQCHGSHRPGNGIAYLNNCLNYKNLPEPVRPDVLGEIQFCLGQSTSGTRLNPPSLEWVPVSGQLSEPATVSGKGGYVFLDADARLTTGAARRSPLPVSDLRARVLTSEQGLSALDAAERRLGPGAAGAVSGGFVVACTRPCTPERSLKTAECLNRYVAPLAAEFNILRPRDLVTVYLAHDPQELPVLADRLHGVRLPLGTIAYSVSEDLSIVGFPEGIGCGSLAHELLHLSIRSSFGDSPAWLEEGLASEIAVAQPRSATFALLKSWRDESLRRYWGLRPSVGQLLNMTWADFVASAPEQLDQVAAIHAMAAVFVRYLDAQGKLTSVYSAMRDRRFSADGSQVRTGAELLSDRLGASTTQVDAHFIAWFREVGALK